MLFWGGGRKKKWISSWRKIWITLMGLDDFEYGVSFCGWEDLKEVTHLPMMSHGVP